MRDSRGKGCPRKPLQRSSRVRVQKFRRVLWAGESILDMDLCIFDMLIVFKIDRKQMSRPIRPRFAAHAAALPSSRPARHMRCRGSARPPRRHVAASTRRGTPPQASWPERSAGPHYLRGADWLLYHCAWAASRRRGGNTHTAGKPSIVTPDCSMISSGDGRPPPSTDHRPE